MSIADDQPADLVSLLQSRVARAPQAEAFIYLEDGESHQSSLTYAALDLWARRIAAYLEASQAGGKWALLLYPPGLDFISAFLGCLYAGVVAVPVYPPRLNRPAPRIQAIAADCRARFALTTSAILANIEKRFEHAPELAALEWINTQEIPEGIESGWQDPQVRPDALACLQYTSGSTAAPKGVMISHANYRGTISGAPNFAFELCVDTINAQDRQNLDLSSLDPMFTGAEPIRPQTLERFAAAFAECGFRRSAFYPCYRLAETTLLVAGGRGSAVPAVLTLEKRALEEHLVRPAAPDSASTTETVALVGCGGELLEEKIRRQETRRRYLEGRLRLAHLWRPSEGDAVRQKDPDPAAADRQSPQIAAGDGAAERIEAKIIELIASRLKVPASRIHPDQPFSAHGLDSAQAVGMSGNLEVWLDRRLSPTLARDYPTPRSLSRYLAGSASAAQSMEIGKYPGSQAPPMGGPIAIIGMGVRFPGAAGPEAFWKLLAEGRDAVSEVPTERFDADALYDSEMSAGKITTRWGAFLSDVDRFDAAFFGISPREAARMDPQQRIFLEVAWEALEHGGQSPEALRGTAAGVFVGVSSYDYSGSQFSEISQIDAYAGTGNAHSIIANRLSYFLDLRGPSLAIDTACSSSLVAVHQGVQSLRAGESDLVLAGGVNLILSPELTITFSQARMMAADGRCKTFDGRADGYVRGEGCGVVVLKRLADAIRDNDSIHALILGSAVNQDGRSNGLTAPNGQAQRAVIQAALEQAGISGDQVEYVEAHGTGTPLGDPIEIAALRSVLEPHPDRARPLLVGSVKTNIGHLEAAAGIAGLIKVALMLGRGKIPAHLHFESLNPYIDLVNSAIQIPTALRAWPESTGARLAGVSSFGFGGTNAHMILSQAEAAGPGDASESSSSTSEPGARPPILTLAAPGHPGLLQMAERYRDRLSAIESFPEWADLAYTSNVGRAHFAQRIAVAAPSASQARDRLAGLVDSLPDRQPARSRPRVAFLFSGQGAQYVGMGRQLYASEPGFREVFDECAEYLSMDLHRPLQELIWPVQTGARAHPRTLPDTLIAQPALFALEYALARLWSSWGIRPDVLIGHSIGEYAAACLAGIFTLAEACKLVAARGRLMAELPAGGGMAAVFAAASQIEPLIAPFADRISIAAENGPRTVVISGARSALEVILSQLQKQTIEYRWLEVSHAFHSPLVEPVLSQFRQIAGNVDYRPAGIPLISNLRGQVLEPEEIPDADYWVDHIREPVLFARGMVALVEKDVQVCLEIGPRPVLLGMARHCVDSVQREQMSWLASLREGEADQEVMASALAALYERGAFVDWNAYHRGSQRKKRPAPTYPFQRQRYWIEGPPVWRAPGYQFRRVLQVAIPVLECQVPHLGQSGMVGLILDAVRQACEVEDPGLESIQFERQAARPGRVQVLVTPSANRATFQLFGRDGEGDWVPLARGAATWAPEAQEAGPGSPAARPLIAAHSQEALEFRSDTASDEVRTIASDAPAGKPAPDRSEQTPAGGGAGVGTDRLESYLRQRAAAALGLSARQIRAADRLDMLGLDSLMAVELRNALEKDLNIRLPVAQFLSGATISELARAGQDLLADSHRDETASSIPLGDELGGHPLTHDQQAMWLLDQLMPQDITFNVSGAVRLRGPFDPQMLRTSLDRMMARHAMLRARFEVVDGEPAQIIRVDLPVPYEEIDARSWDQAQLGLQLRSDAYRPFAMEREPAWRMVLYDLAEDDRILLVAMQHTITDFWSMTIFAAELMAIYRAVQAGHEPDLPAVPVKFTDFVRWERENLQSRQGQEHLAYWKRKLAPPLPELNLPTDLPRPAVQTFRGNTHHMQLDPGLSERLGRLAQEQGVTLYMLLLAAFKVLLHRHSGQTDLLVGSAMSGRNHPQLEHLIGYFINPVALRTQLSGELGLDELLQRVRQTVLEAFDHQDYPPALLAEHLGVQRDPSRPPLFSATFIFQKAQLEDFGDLNTVALGMPGAELEMGDVRLASLELKGTPSQFDLTLMMADTPRGLAAAMIYNADLFLPETMDRWLGQLRQILEGICASPQQKIFALPILPKQERELLMRWNRTRADYPAGVTLQTLFEAQVRRTPHAEALRFGSLSISYQELNRRANRLAHFLRARGVGPECLVGLYLQRSIEMVVAIYAVIKAGAAYVPFDPTYPTDRVAFMLQDTAVPILLSTNDLRAPISSQSDSPAEIFCLDTQWEELAGFAADNPPVSAKPGNLAYVIFTSGSTGQPKGVMNEHAGICNRLLWMQSEYQLSGRDRVLQKTPYSFDVSVWEFFWPLQVGACLVIARPEGHKDADYLVETIASESITTLHFVPSMLQSFLRHEDVERCVSIRQVFCSGEALPYDLQERFFARLNCRLHNLYGPTEAAVDVTYWACQGEQTRKIVPIGRPVANTRMYILDRRGRRLPIGAAGELFIGGIQVARGYLNRPALTADKFLPDPYAKEDDPRSGSRTPLPDPYSRPGRLYRTGDLARFLPDGSIEFLGRADFQVKVRGFRIELGEIEAALVSHALVREAVVVASGDGEDRHLVAYYVPVNGPEKPSHSELIRYLKQRLPEYMLPAVLVDLEGLPLSPNGKVDRRALPAPLRIRPELIEAYVAPRSPLEIELAEMCAQLLDLDRVGVFDDFFALGGSSLQVTRLLYRARERFGQPVPLRRLFETPTVAGLAALLDEMRADGVGSAANGQGLRPAVSQQQLLEDVRLPADFQINDSQGLDARVEQPRELFLTGATGFLGAYLAKDLLQTTDARLHCLVRAESEESALRRVIGNLERYGLWEQDWTERIAVHCGDLGEKDLGMAAARFGELAGRIEAIFHNGASVNFIASYRALRSINVGGTQEILRLACMGQIKPVHFISTLGIFNTDMPDDGAPITEEGYPDHLGIPLSGYTQSKWVSDRVIDLARSRGAPVSIYRPGVISGDSRTGAWNHADMVSGLIAASAAVGMIPDLDLPVDLAPVDYVSRAIVHLALHRDRVGSVYHLANPQPLPYAELARWFEQIGFPVRVVSFAEWRAGLNEMAADQAGAVEWQIYLPLLEEIAEEQVFLPKIDCQNTLRGLRGSEISSPAVDAGLLETYYRSFFTQNRE